MRQPANVLSLSRAPGRIENAIAIASGKGGVGKTWLSTTLAHALARRGDRILLLDGDLGLANVDVQLGLGAARDLAGVIRGHYPLAQAVTTFGAGGFDVISGRSGGMPLAGMTVDDSELLHRQLDPVAPRYDTVILDLAAGVDQVVLRLAAAARVIIVTITGDPASLTDSYAFMKLAARSLPPPEFRIIVNMATDTGDGHHSFGRIRRVCRNFLGFSPELLGVVHRDDHVVDSVRRQKALLSLWPGCTAALDVGNLLRKIRTPAMTD